MNKREELKKMRTKRARRVRSGIFGTAERPRLSVFKSNKYVYLQLIDDSSQKTVASASTRDTKEKGKLAQKAATLGNSIAKVAEDRKISGAVFDRGRYKYHGIIKMIVEEARKNGLKV